MKNALSGKGWGGGGAELIPAPMGNKRPVGLKDTKRIHEFWLGGLQHTDSENTV